MAIPQAGAGAYFKLEADETVTEVYAHRTLLFYIHVINDNAADSFLQLFDADNADITVGTTTPTYSFLLPAEAGATSWGVFSQEFPVPLQFNTALNYAVTTAPMGDTGPSSAVIVNMSFLAG